MTTKPTPELTPIPKRLVALLVVDLDEEVDQQTTYEAVKRLRAAVTDQGNRPITGGRIAYGWVGVDDYAEQVTNLIDTMTQSRQ